LELTLLEELSKKYSYMSEKGSLFVVATPIGNLSDVTYRAIDTLSSVDFILAEDTRKSSIFLKHYSIKTKMLSYHDFTTDEKITSFVDLLESGKRIALISDAGTPTISDPGFRLIQSCIEKEIQCIPIPGPSSITAALSIAGLPTDRFTFIGFLPHKKGRMKKINSLVNIDHTIILFESPHRLQKTLKELSQTLGNRPVVICRELTKLYEEIIRGNLSELITEIESKKLKGEFVLLIGKNNE
jgi:16S rRNA (cytidine1402-2'-O)-methyltransferase